MTQMPYAPPQQYPQQPYSAQPAYPGYPPQAPAQQYYAQQPAQQQFMPGVQAPPQQQAQPLAQGTLDDFFDQPSAGGGASLKFAAIGTTYVGVVARAIGSGDVQQQTNVQGVPQTFKDGRPKFVMKVPLSSVAAIVNGQPQGVTQDGLATWFVKGQARDELVRAMAEAGAPAGAPEAGAVIQVTYVADRSAGVGFNPAKQFQVVYQRPANAPAVPPAATPVAQAPEAQAQPLPPAPPAPPVNYAPPTAPAPAPQYAPPVQQQAPAPQAPQAQVAQGQPTQGFAPGVDMDPAQQELLNKILAGQSQQ